MQWKTELSALWRSWDAAIERTRHVENPKLPPLKFPRPAHTWIEEPSRWACLHRGLGDYARFALASYFRYPGDGRMCDAEEMRALQAHIWLPLFKELHEDNPVVDEKQLKYFNGQVAEFAPSETEKRVARLQPLFDDERFWPALAWTTNKYMKGRGQLRPVEADILRQRRFAGPTAVTDYIHYLRSGVVAPRQAAFADELADLGVILKKKEEIDRDMDYFRSPERAKGIAELARHLAERDPTDLPHAGKARITCLWSTLEPHGLIATARLVIQKYRHICIRENRVRLPVIYVPVGLDAQKHYVSRRGVVRDLYVKLRVRRAEARGEKYIPRRLSEYPTDEEVDAAIGEIRKELAKSPALLIFGLYHLPSVGHRRAIEEELLDAPLPYIIDRLMIDTGALDAPIAPQDSYGKQILILADGPLERIAHLPVRSFKLSPCLASQTVALLESSGCHRVAAHLASHYSNQELKVRTNEIELSVIDSALSIAEYSRDRLKAQALKTSMVDRVFRKTTPGYGEERVERLVVDLINHVLDEARDDSDAAWFATLLHIVSLTAGGLRQLTAARVLAAYAVATASTATAGQPQWLSSTEAPLWFAESEGSNVSRLSVAERDKLALRVRKHIRDFEDRAGELVRGLPSAASAGFDEYSHPYESPEVPTFLFEFDEARELLELRSPLVRRIVSRQFRLLRPHKHALISRLLAEEFIRRVAIVQCHHPYRDMHSLVEKRYVILAIYHGLHSVRIRNGSLLSVEGQRRSRWLIQPPSRVGVFRWIYQWLYTEQLNAGQDALSEWHGAEFFKRELLEHFWRADPHRPHYRSNELNVRRPMRVALRHFRLKAELLYGLMQVSLRTSDPRLAKRILRCLEALCGRARAALVTYSNTLSEHRRRAWLAEIERVERKTQQLRMDAAVEHSAAISSADPRVERSRRHALLLCVSSALQSRGEPRVNPAQAVVTEILSALRYKLRERIPLVPFSKVRVERLRVLVPQRLQYLYDCLMRYAELAAGTAENLPEHPRRARRRVTALALFELAEGLRILTRDSSTEDALRLSPGPVGSAARICLALGYRTEHEEYFERAHYYWYHLIGNYSRSHIEGISALIVQAAVIRLRDSGRRLPLALRYLQTAETSLLHYPDQLNVWFRFYLERAQLFRAWVMRAGISPWERSRCIYYCRADVASLVRLAGARSQWVARGKRVLKGLPSVDRKWQWACGEGQKPLSQAEIDGRIHPL